jgi:hypothetical protein
LKYQSPAVTGSPLRSTVGSDACAPKYKPSIASCAACAIAAEAAAFVSDVPALVADVAAAVALLAEAVALEAALVALELDAEADDSADDALELAEIAAVAA